MSVKGSKKKMLSDRIVAKLNKPKIKDYDIEDEEFNYDNGSSSKNNGHDDDDDENDDAEEEREREELAKRDHYVKMAESKLRGRSSNLGEKYTGSKVGRSELYDDDSSESSNSEGVEENEEGDNSENDEDILADVTDSEAENASEEISEEAQSEDSSADGKEEADDDVDIDAEAEEDEEHEEEEHKRNTVARLLDTEKQQIFNRLSTSAKTDTLKGYTIIRQGAEYDKILDARIKLQKAMIAGNSLPINSKVFEDNKTDQTDSIIEATESKLYGLIDKLIRLRAKQLLRDDLVKEEVKVNLKKRKLSSYLEANASIDKTCAPIRKSILMKWSSRVQSASGIGALNQGKFSVINQNVWTQVSNQLSDLDRLIKKTKINRRGITPIGYSDELEKSREADDTAGYDDDDSDSGSNIKTAGLSNIDKSLQTNQYIFDDDDFYRLLLNDMVNKKLDQKQANNAAILMLSKNKMQKNYDRMATKGRKLKYTVQEPLIQYEIPRRKYYSWGDDQIDELFAGLFGINLNINDSDNEAEDTSDAEQDGQQKEDIAALKKSGLELFG
ncbi:hypothetical protein PMKS-001521 [Pichia membranifaciens]|uniref:Protein BFR2 n=1 Tax=Pichia membranifaciens TaxID=4926 RepID=A0A1Q2YF93_9ASCO|nr:hypothetical protein PMKS-001521 [Pichia membranifaciens]